LISLARQQHLQIMLEFFLSVATLVGQVDISATQTQYEFLNDDNTITTVIVDNYTP